MENDRVLKQKGNADTLSPRRGARHARKWVGVLWDELSEFRKKSHNHHCHTPDAHLSMVTPL